MDRFGIVSGDNSHDLGFCKVHFDWNTECWYGYI